MREDTLPTIFQNRIKKYGNRVALREKILGVWQEISWVEYNENVKNFCLGLVSLGLKKGDNVSILGENHREWLYADLAIQTAGAVAVGVYPTNPATQVKYIVEHSQSKFFIAEDQEQIDKILKVIDDLPLLKNVIVWNLKGLRKYDNTMMMSFQEVLELGEELDRKEPDLYQTLIDKTDPNDIAIIVYTSGTTGPPKGAMLSHHNLLSMLGPVMELLNLNEDDEIVSYLPLCHVAERIFSVFIPIKVGCTVNFAEDVSVVQKSLGEIYPTVFFAVPRIWEKIHTSVLIRIEDSNYLKKLLFKLCMPIGQKVTDLRLAKKKVNILWKTLYFIAYLSFFRALQDRLGLSRGKVLLSAAAPISPMILKFFHSIGLQIIEGYGMTEAGAFISVHRKDDIRLGTVGTSAPGIEVKIADDGEILIKGEGIFVGYYRDPEATKKAKIDGWLYGGDVGEIDGDGHIRITDRKKDIIITAGGKNLSPSEMENRLKCSIYISEAMVIGNRRKYCTALIQIDYENVSNWAQEKSIFYTTFKSLAQNPQVYDLIRKEVEKANRDFAKVESIKKFTLLDKELDQDDEEITATMKVRRRYMETAFKELIDAMYKEE